MTETLTPDVDYERAACPACGNPDCTFPPECQAVVMEPAPERGYPHHDHD